jgi:integrase
VVRYDTEQGDCRGNLSRMFQKAVTEAGLEGRGLNIRQLRHTAATLMMAAGCDFLDVQQRLGHSSAAITLEVYSRVLSSRRMAGTDLIEAAMGSTVQV